jgi:hypothetical protein
MKVAFDSNVWRIISSPDKFPKEKYLTDFKKVRQAIIDKKIDPYISETVFTIEAIKKTERKGKLDSKKVKIDVNGDATDNGWIGSTFTIRPERGIDFDKNPILKKHFDDAIALGFKITRFPRIAGLVNENVEKVRFIQTGDELKKYLEKIFEVGRKIERNGAGMTAISRIGKKYDRVWFRGLKKAPDSEIGNIAKAAAEWADGDSIAICIALGCDYFCTRDQAKSAGVNSVFSSKNLSWLSNDYGLKVISPEDLAKRI